ncbi:MAG: hypothetical protein KAT35_01875 [Candidatus Aenigmarchaeota archaeon]|nr:hypothetical protein [Candidatus Aenigmarchaeota archaeon]
MVKAIIAIIAAIIVVTGVIFAADAMLNQYGLDLSSLLNILFASMSASDVNAMEFDDVNSSMIGGGTYETLSNEKEQLEDAFEYARPMIDELNSDTELTSAMMDALGEYYVVYLYSVVREPIEFKVFEWTIIFENGLVTGFENGKTVETPNVQIVADHEIVGQLLAQNCTQSEIIGWVEEQRIIVSPITEIGKVLQVLPTILERLEM